MPERPVEGALVVLLRPRQRITATRTSALESIDGVTVTALLKLSGASATEIRNFFPSGLAGSPRDQDAQAADTTTTLVSTGADSSGLLTPSASMPAGVHPVV